MSNHNDSERPQKRARTDYDGPSSNAPLNPPIDSEAPSTSNGAPTGPIAPEITALTDLEREVRAGITEYVCPDNLGFNGVLKQRYTDFLVNEIGLDGKVLHLRSIGAPVEPKKGKEVAKKEEKVVKEVEKKVEKVENNGDGDVEMKDGKDETKEQDDETKNPVEEEEKDAFNVRFPVQLVKLQRANNLRCLKKTLRPSIKSSAKPPQPKSSHW
jgi:tRNA pseudouridine13 synthase